MLRINNYRAGEYLRLSRDDGDDRESESIDNQRDIINSFVADHCDEIEVVEEYIDDGFTGTNFNRPGFKKMIEDIESGKINCIITKDLSRFGRDHIDTGYYLERYLPANNIRYIAIGDNVDTLYPDGLQFLTFKLSFNDYYAQDISNKIKSVKQRKIEKGEFQAGIAPYGYKKDTVIKNHLVPDNNVVEIVRDIFDMYVNKGMSTVKIADKLNERNVIPPAIYLKIPVFMQNKNKKPSEYRWDYSQISKMLQNEVYIGNVVGRKFQKVSHKVDKVRLNKKEDFIIVENKHKAIIDMETWNKAQEKISKYRKVKNCNNNHPLKEFIYCGECGGKSTYRVRTKTRKNGQIWENRTFICSNKNSGRTDCKCMAILQEEIEEKVKNAIREELKKIDYTDEELSNILNKAENKVNSRVVELEKQVDVLKAKLKETEVTMKTVYKDKIQNIITADDFNVFYEDLKKEKGNIIEQIHQNEIKIETIRKTNKYVNYNEIRKIANEILNLKQPNRELYSKLIERIEFDSQKNITVTFTFGHFETVKKAV